MEMTTKEKIIMVDMAASILAILLIGVFLGQAVSVSLVYHLIPVHVTVSMLAAEIWIIQTTLVMSGYLAFQYTIRRVFGWDILTRIRASNNTTDRSYDRNGPTTRHLLKTINPFFADTWNGEKSFEIRIDDRGFRKGDLLLLMEFIPSTEKFTGREILCRVNYVLSDTFPGLAKGYCAMGLSIFAKTE